MFHQLFVSERLLFTSVNVKPMESSLAVKKTTAHHTCARRFLFRNGKKNNPITEEKSLLNFRALFACKSLLT